MMHQSMSVSSTVSLAHTLASVDCYSQLGAVKNHGILEATIAAAVQAANNFFSLPSAFKMEVSISKFHVPLIPTHSAQSSISIRVLTSKDTPLC